MPSAKPSPAKPTTTKSRPVGKKGTVSPCASKSLSLPEEGGDGGATVEPLQQAPTGKSSLVLGLLQREQGATMVELTTATGWLPHTVRAAISGLRKRGYHVDRAMHQGQGFYRARGAGQ